ncbi:YaaC family protein [Paraburkholderia mimosarum]|uniref:YaaC family protein n=1 Tax=Paraburkholderia mimosarum TaxID=312026 RepID=UPI00138DE4FE|nr:YaaC family protein [Paraburkholderia mimosarum]
MIEIQYLESTENLRKNIHNSQGWRPKAGQTEEIAACLRQGRLFYEAARRAPLEIRPLELYYGTVSYAKALVLATSRNLRLSALPRSHGVSDRSPQNARLNDLTASIEERGTFQAFNDCVRNLNSFRALALSRHERTFTFPCAESTDISGMTLSLKDIFGRLPGLESLYRATFDEREKIDFVQIADEGYRWTVCVSIPSWEIGFDNLVEMIRVVRNRMPFLEGWLFSEASKTSLIFVNARRTDDELLRRNMIHEFEWGFQAVAPLAGTYFTEIETSLGHLMALPSHQVGAIFMQPIDGHFIAFQSLQFLALHLLSSLVRYLPATWMHSLSRSANNARAADDAMLALIEAFMEGVQTSIPKFVAEVIAPSFSI